MAHHHVTSQNLPADGDFLDRSRVSRLSLILGAVGLVGTAVSLFLLFWGPLEARGIYAYSWLFALFYFFTLAAGGVFWTLLHNVSNSGWGTSVRRVFENVGSVFPWLGLLALPLLCPAVQQYLYEWMNVHREAQGDVKDHLHHVNHLMYVKHWYLNIPFWTWRVVFYFVSLGAVIVFLRRLSTAQDVDPNPGTRRLFLARRHSTWTLAILAITVTFAGFDLLMGLDYTWFSTMWGVYLFAGSALSSMALIIIVVAWLRRLGHLQNVVTEEHYHIMGKLLFCFTVFWAYIAFSQDPLMYVNITEETKYFLIRNTEGWNVGNLVLVFGHFLIPFVLLLPAWVKRSPKYLVPLACYLLVFHILDIYLVVIPERGISLGNIAPEVFGEIRPSIPGAFWFDILAFVTIGSVFFFLLLNALKRHSLFPHRDPRILESANVSN